MAKAIRSQKESNNGPKKQRPKANPGQVIQDERFAAAYSDPRFQRFPKAQRKVEIDERFAGMFKDESFQVRSAVDKRGRKLGKQAQRENMRKYYRLQNEEEDWKKSDASHPGGLPKAEAEPEAKAGRSQGRVEQKAEPPAAQLAEPASDGSSEDDESESLDGDDAHAQERWARVRGLTGPQESSSEDEDSSEEEDEGNALISEDEGIDLKEWGVGAMAANPDETIPEVEEETSRLALVDLDWSKVQAVDIFAMLKSFVAKGQQIQRVTVYPSDYGLARMAEEAKLGPVGLFGSSRQPQGNSSAQVGTEAPSGRAGQMERAWMVEGSQGDASSQSDLDADSDRGGDADSDDEAGSDSEAGEDVINTGYAPIAARDHDSDSGDEVDHRRLQMYERSRLRYYYAIIECDDVATAAQLYRECDGLEFEHSANKLDLRYVPDGQSFKDREARDIAEEVPANYEAPVFGTAALQHTRPKLTWDADDDDRKKLLAKPVTKDQMREDDFKAYLGSESEEEEEVAAVDPQAQRYRELLSLGADPRRGGKAWGAEEEASDANADSEEGTSSDEDGEDAKAQAKKDRDMELEVTFAPALDELSQRLAAKKKEKIDSRNDTVWEAYLRRRRQKRDEARQHGKRADSDDDYSSDDFAAQADPDFQHDNDDDAFNDPFFQDGDGSDSKEGAANKSSGKVAKSGGTGKAARAGGKAEKQEQQAAQRRQRAELELLLMDDAALQDAAKLGGIVGSAPQPIVDGPKAKLSRKARIAAKKADRQARRAGSDDEAEGAAGGGASFNVNLADQRFAALYNSPDFALDPTDPRFSASSGAKAILAEASKRRRKGDKAMNIEVAPAPIKPVAQAEVKVDNLNALVSSLKRKAGANLSKTLPGQSAQKASKKKR